MADIAEMLYQGASKAAESAVPDLAGEFRSGAQLANQIEQVQIARENLEAEKEKNNLFKLDKLTEAIEKGITKVPKKAQPAYFKGVQQNFAGKLGLPFTDEFIDALTSSDVNQGAVGEQFTKFRAAIRSGIQSNDMKEANLMASEILQAYSGDVTKFGEFLNKAYGQEVTALAQEKALGLQMEKATPEYAARQAEATSTGKEKADWEAGGGRAGVESSLKKLEEIAGILDSGEIKTGGITTVLPWLKSEDVQTMINPKAEDLKTQARGSLNSILKQTLGGQFTQQEGEKILNQIWDPRQPPKVNAKRIRDQIEKLRADALSKEKQFSKLGVGVGTKTKSPPKKGKNIHKNPAFTPKKKADFRKLSPENKKKVIEILSKRLNMKEDEVEGELE